MKALVIDDSRAARFMVGNIMKELGFDVIQAEDGLQAVNEVKKNPQDLKIALVDWNMPEMNGLEFVQTIVKEKLKDFKVMMVTTETEMMQVVKAMEEGADEYVMKPFTKDVLIDKLKILGFEIKG
jgi:two-component system chemotaxis response regulator CheY